MIFNLIWDCTCVYYIFDPFLVHIVVMNVSLWADTSELSGYKMKTRVNYAWPRLTSPKVVMFPLTALANESIMDIPVRFKILFCFVLLIFKTILQENS